MIKRFLTQIQHHKLVTRMHRKQNSDNCVYFQPRNMYRLKCVTKLLLELKMEVVFHKFVPHLMSESN